MAHKIKGTDWTDPGLPSDKATGININREATYGSPTPNMIFLAERWSALLGIRISPQMASVMMIDLKIMREVMADFPLDYADNLEDICGWTNVLYKVKKELIEDAE